MLTIALITLSKSFPINLHATLQIESCRAALNDAVSYRQTDVKKKRQKLRVGKFQEDLD